VAKKSRSAKPTSYHSSIPIKNGFLFPRANFKTTNDVYSTIINKKVTESGDKDKGSEYNAEKRKRKKNHRQQIQNHKIVSLVVLREIQSERARAVQVLVAIDTDERGPAFVQRSLETDDDKLERIRRV